jgi:hypothetical protein
MQSPKSSSPHQLNAVVFVDVLVVYIIGDAVFDLTQWPIVDEG